MTIIEIENMAFITFARVTSFLSIKIKYRNNDKIIKIIFPVKDMADNKKQLIIKKNLM